MEKAKLGVGVEGGAILRVFTHLHDHKFFFAAKLKWHKREYEIRAGEIMH